MGKVRRIDWSPDEWLAGTSRLLTLKQAAVYMTVLMVIYSRGGQCPNDATFLAGHFKFDEDDNDEKPGGQTWRGFTRGVRACITTLVRLGKLHVSPDGKWLTNGRADAELGKAHDRMDSAARAGVASGAVRRSRRHPPDIPWTSPGHPPDKESKPKQFKDLAGTIVRNHQPSTTNHESESESGAARARGRGLATSHAHDDKSKPAMKPLDPRLADAAAKARAKLLKGPP